MSGFLHVGDLVSLQYSVDGDPGKAAQGVLATQGMPDVNMWAQLTAKDEAHPSRSIMAQSVFLVRQQHSYSVARQLQNKLDKSGLSLAEASDRAQFRNILREREREKVQNLEEFRNARGREVRYGMIIQFQHNLTQRYIKVSRLPSSDKEGRKVVVDREAAEGSWFRVHPRLRVHTEGERVTGKHEGSTLKILQYRSYKDERQKDQILLAGQEMRIAHKESDASLRGDSLRNTVHNCKTKQGTQPSQTIWELGKAERATGRTVHDGNACMWDRCFQIYHVASARFLGTRAQPTSPSAEGAAAESAARRPVLHTDASHDTLWELVPLYNSGEASIAINKFFFIRHVATGMWLHNEVDPQAGRKKTVDGLSEADDVLLPLLVSPNKRDEDIFGLHLTNDEHYKDLLFARAAVDDFLTFESQFVGEPRPRENINFAPIIKTTSELIKFVTISDDPNPLTREGLPHSRRQQLLREQLLLDLAFEAGQMPLADTPYTTWRVLTRCTREAAPFTIKDHLEPKSERLKGNNGKLHAMMLITVRLAQMILREDAANRAHVMKMGYVPLWQAQLGYALKIAPALSEVFSDNELLLDRVADDTIHTYVGLIRNAGREARYVDFLITLCAAKGKAVRHNQDRICKYLVQQAPELLVTLHERTAKSAQTPSNKSIEVYVKGDSKYFTAIEGEPTLAAWLDAQDAERRTFFERCLTLFGRLVLDRNETNTPIMQSMLPLSLLQAIIKDASLNEKHLGVCSQAMALVRVLYVNNIPHEPLAYLQTVRVWSDVKPQAVLSLTACLNAGVALDGAHFDGLKRYIEARLLKSRKQVASQLAENKMLLEILQTLYFLVEAGFYDLEQLQSIRAPLLLLLDGRDDILGRAGYHEEPHERYQVIRVKDCDTMLIMECKLWICKLLQLVFTVRLDMRLTKMLVQYKQEWEAGYHSKADGDKGRRSEQERKAGEIRLNQLRLSQWGKSAGRHFRTSRSRTSDVEMLLPGKSFKSSRPRGESGAGFNWRGSAKGRLAKARHNVCEATLDLLKLEGDDIFDSTLRPEERQTFHTVLMDLLFYKNPRLVDASISLLVEHFEQKWSLQSALNSVQVLVKPSMCRIFGDFDILLRQLNTLSSRRSLFTKEIYDAAHAMSVLVSCLYHPDLEQIPVHMRSDTLLTRRETTGDHTLGLYLHLLGTVVASVGSSVVTVTPHRHAKRDSTASLGGRASQGAPQGDDPECPSEGETVWIMDEAYVVKEARGLELHLDRPLGAWSGKEDVKVAWLFVQRDSPAVDKDMQRLLRNMSAHKLVLKLLALPFDLSKKRPEEFELRQMVLTGYRLLKAMTLEYSQLQQVLSTHKPLFLTHLEADLYTVDISPVGLITTVCRDNRVACLQADEAMIDKFVQMAAVGRAPRHVRFLRMLIDPQGRVIRRNQELIISKFAENSGALLLFNGKAGREERAKLIAANEMVLKPRGTLNYHVQLIYLLAGSTVGKNAVIELTVRDLVPIDELMAHLLDPSVEKEVQLSAAYVTLFDEAYTVTDLFQKELGTHPSLPLLLRSFRRQIETYTQTRLGESRAALKDSKRHDNYIFDVLAPAIGHIYEERHYREQCPADMHAASRELVETLIVLLRKALGHGLPTHRLTACLSTMIARFNVINPDGVRLPADYEELQAAAAKELNEQLEKTNMMRRTLTMPSPQDALAAFTADVSALMHVEEEFDQLVDVFQTGFDEDRPRGAPEALGVQYCRQVINQLQLNRVPQGGTLSEAASRQAVAMVKVLTAVASVEGEGEEIEAIRVKRQLVLDELGATHVAVMMCTCVDDVLCEMGLKLGIAMLHGGHQTVQSTLHRVLTDPTEQERVRPFDGTNGRFLGMMKYRLELGVKELRERKFFYEERADRLRTFEADTANLSPATVAAMRAELEKGFNSRALVVEVMLLLQQTCEGHFQEMQDYLRDQPQEVTDIDLVTEVFHFLLGAEAEVDADNVDQLQQCLITLVEFVQGNASRKNANTLIDAKCIELLSRLIQSDTLSALKNEMQDEVRAQVANLLSAMLEGNNEHVKMRMRGVIDLKAILKICNSYYLGAHMHLDNKNLSTKSLLTSLQFEKPADGEEEGMTWRERAAIRSARRQMQLDTGFALFLLVLDLASNDDCGEDGLEDEERGLTEALDEEALRFYRSYTAHVEIINAQGKLERVLFPFPTFCHHLTEESKQALLEHVDRDTPGRIVFDFFDAIDSLHAEMKHLAKLEGLWLWRMLLRFKPIAVRSIFSLACVVNLLVVAFDVLIRNDALLSPAGCTMQGQVVNGATCDFHDKGWQICYTVLVIVIRIFGVLQCLAALTVFLLYAMQSGPVRQDALWRAATGLNFAEAWERARTGIFVWLHFIIMSTLYLLHDWKLLFFTVELFASILGLTVSPYFYAFLLLDIVLRDADLQNVFKAITSHGRSILVTAFFGFIVIYFFAIIGMILLNQDIHPSFSVVYDDPIPGFEDGDLIQYDYCKDLLTCLVTATSEGLRGGDIGAMMNKRMVSDSYFWFQMLYTFLYWTIMITVLLNVIFGIIIDTFSELRTDSLRMKQDMQNSCFICRVDRFTLDTMGNGFETHIKQDHNMWNYLNMIVHVREKDSMEHNGWEGYIAEMMAQRDLSFFPRNQAITLTKMKQREQAETLRAQATMTKTADDVNDLLKKQAQILKELGEMKDAQARMESTLQERSKK
ncbi:hypothetical protein AB1Y20_006454 [Prymnesium parvum]|uniref:MIR domain-containing protein n=1 Tax=Prymnesium parvum TaxID=97485 RepID=A0AB34IY65_PRYPA